MIRSLGTIFAGLLGLAFGSFLNVCLSRWPRSESIVEPRSHCLHCGHMLAWWENVPLVSWLALRGRCRSCRAWIGWRYPLVELVVGVLWAITGWRFIAVATDALFSTAEIWKAGVSALGLMIFFWLVVALAMLDAEHLWLPDWLTLPGLACGFVFTVLTAVCNFVTPQSRIAESAIGYFATTILLSLLDMAAAAALVLVIRRVYWMLRKREGIGLGDAKLMALLAAWLGLPNALLAFGLGVIMGAMVGLVLLAFSIKHAKTSTWAVEKLPLGAFLCLGGVISALWGDQIIAAYEIVAGV